MPSIFADETKLMGKIPQILASTERSACHYLLTWATTNNMSLNESKFEVFNNTHRTNPSYLFLTSGYLSYRWRRATPVVKDLGVFISNDYSLKPQVTEVVNSAGKIALWTFSVFSNRSEVMMLTCTRH